MTQYAQRNNIKLAHPKIDIPVDVSTSDNGNMNITLGIGDKSDDGSFAWTMYGISRAAWRSDKDGKLSEQFSKAYPNERLYRHSLAEEMDALHLVLVGIKGNKNVKKTESIAPNIAEIKRRRFA